MAECFVVNHKNGRVSGMRLFEKLSIPKSSVIAILITITMLLFVLVLHLTIDTACLDCPRFGSRTSCTRCEPEPHPRFRFRCGEMAIFAEPTPEPEVRKL
jgi:hypothetical protein